MSKIRHTNVPASYLVLIKEGKTLLLRRYNTGYEDGKYSVIAGHVDPGETFSQTMVREAKEEAGITIKPNDLTVAHVMHRNSGMNESQPERIDVFFTVRNWEGDIQIMEPNKCDELSWFSLDALPENIIPYIRQALESIRDGVFYSEHGWGK